MAIAVFMILNQLHIAPEIVTITYAALIGAVALGSAIAFGLGGRSVAQRMLEDAYQRGQDEQDRVKRDLDTGKQRAEQRVDEAQTQVQGAGAPSGAGPQVSGEGSYRSR
jgi:hypothetical protein